MPTFQGLICDNVTTSSASLEDDVGKTLSVTSYDAKAKEQYRVELLKPNVSDTDNYATLCRRRTLRVVIEQKGKSPWILGSSIKLHTHWLVVYSIVFQANMKLDYESGSDSGSDHEEDHQYNHWCDLLSEFENDRFSIDRGYLMIVMSHTRSPDVYFVAL
uniref:AlNc14C95G5842 protein n=1 Tax=Albugo laibachii Nc14 TaxID=890382 RepID=F0WGW6_9STRA|nr:AlNc14C95G5842 [Albugo laibachii Nc14]|eukprot:CCA20481.1 AlNc14C95G5842 [Albugo laibachii Nc14]